MSWYALLSLRGWLAAAFALFHTVRDIKSTLLRSELTFLLFLLALS